MNVPQRLHSSQKTEKWQRDCIDDIVTSSSISGANYYVYTTRLKRNYDLVNNLVHEEDIRDLCKKQGIEFNIDRIRSLGVNLIAPKVSLLLGEELKRPFNPKIVQKGEAGVKEFAEAKLQAIKEYMGKVLSSQMSDKPEEVQQQELDAIDKKFKYTYLGHVEKIAAGILEYLLEYEEMKFKFNKGFKHRIISGVEVYYVGIEGGEPVTRVVNPLNFDFALSPDHDFIEESQWAIELRWMHIGDIYSLFWKEMSEKNRKALEEQYGLEDWTDGKTGYNSIQWQDLNELGSRNDVIDELSHNSIHDGQTQNEALIPVYTVEWKSQKKVGFLKFVDEQGAMQEEMVDDSFKITKEMKDLGWSVEWEWINEVWHGYRIDEEIYVKAEPKENQYRGMDNISKVKLSYIGGITNNLNSRSISFVEALKPHQLLYIVILDNLLNFVKKSKGQVLLMEANMRPDGWTWERWFHYLEENNVMFVNTFATGTGNFEGRQTNFNQFTSFDLSFRNVIQELIQLLNFIYQQAEEISGVTKQRLGNVATTELVGNVQHATIQSSHITERLFYLHDNVKKRVCEAMIENAKMAWEGGKKEQYILADGSRQILSFDSDLMNQREIGLFVTDSQAEEAALATLKQLSQQAVQAGAARLSEVAKILQSKSIANVIRDLEEFETRQAEQGQQQQQAEQEALDKQLAESKAAREDQQQHAMDLAKMRAEVDIALKQADIEGKIALEQVKQALNEDSDNGDNLERAKMQQEERLTDKQLAQEKLLKEKDIASKERIANKKQNSNSNV